MWEGYLDEILIEINLKNSRNYIHTRSSDKISVISTFSRSSQKKKKQAKEVGVLFTLTGDLVIRWFSVITWLVFNDSFILVKLFLFFKTHCWNKDISFA